MPTRFLTPRRFANIRKALLLCIATGLSWHQPVLAAPPLVTEDAGTLSPGACQFEIEHRSFRSVKQTDALPACNLFLDTELQLGYLSQQVSGEARGKRVLLQAKKNLLASDAGWNIGVAAGLIRDRRDSADETYLTIPFSRSWGNTTVNLNLGGLRDHEQQQWRTTWAAAVEHEASERITIVGEVFGARSQPESAQIGLRYWLVPKRVQLTTSLGGQRDAGRDGRWTSLGIRFETE